MTRAPMFLSLLLVAASVAAPAVASDIAAPLEDIRDIRPALPIPAPASWGPWLAVGGGALALALGATLLLRRRKERALGLTDRTLARLAAARAHVDAGDAYAFATHLSEILRGYVEARFGLPATQRTTPEFLQDLAGQDIPEIVERRDDLYEFLDACDAAKYARYELGGPRMEAMVDGASRFVEATRPLPRPAAAEEGAAPSPVDELTHAPERGAA